MKILITVIALCAYALAGNPSTTNGEIYSQVQRVKWRGNLSLGLTHTVGDTVSDSIPMWTGGTKPGTRITFAYDVKTNDSLSTQSIFVESKYCLDPVQGLQCDSLWTKAPNHTYQRDTLTPPALHTGFRSVTAPFYILEHNLFRIHIIGTMDSAKTQTIQNAKLIDE